MGAGGRSSPQPRQRPPHLLARRRAAQRPMASGAHAPASRGKEGAMAAVQGARRIRARTDGTDRFRSIAIDLKKLQLGSALIDGEIIVETQSGVPSFSELQQALSAGTADRFLYCVFDLLYCNGAELRQTPLIERKALLQKILEPLAGTGNIRFSEHLEGDGAHMLE